MPNAQPTRPRMIMVPMPMPPARPMGKPPDPAPRRSSTLSLRGSSSKRMSALLVLIYRKRPPIGRIRRIASCRTMHPMPYKQDQDGADDCRYQSPKEAEHGDMQDTGKHAGHKGSGNANKNIGEDAVIGCGDLFCDPSSDRADHQHRQETNPRVTKKSLRVFHFIPPARYFLAASSLLVEPGEAPGCEEATDPAEAK